jgi:hypothetical protein
MKFFSNLFGSKDNSNVFVYSEYAKKILAESKLQINDANLLKATVYLCFAQIACLNSISAEKTRPFIDNMVEDAKSSVLSLSMKVGDLALSDDELAKILKEFPKEASVDKETKINGLAAWEVIYFGFAKEVIIEIANRGKGGPMGVHGYGAVKLLEALRGEGQARDNFMEVTMLLNEMTGKVIKAFR